LARARRKLAGGTVRPPGPGNAPGGTLDLDLPSINGVERVRLQPDADHKETTIMATKKSTKKPAGPKAAKPKQEKPEAIASPVADSKAAKVLELIARPEGASNGEIMEATGRNANTVRGFLSTAAKKRGLQIECVKAPAIYRLKTDAVKSA
jgi:hypothetical protein